MEGLKGKVPEFKPDRLKKAHKTLRTKKNNKFFDKLEQFKQTSK